MNKEVLKGSANYVFDTTAGQPDMLSYRNTDYLSRYPIGHLDRTRLVRSLSNTSLPLID